MTEINPTCRFCRKTLTIPIPDDERLGAMVVKLSANACCDRCADFRRWWRDTTDAMQAITFQLTSDKSNELRARVRGMVERMCTGMVQKAEDYYLMHGLQPYVPEFVACIMDHPDKVKWQAKLFLDRVAAMAYEVHHRPRPATITLPANQNA